VNIPVNLFRYTFGVAVFTLHKVNVVRTFLRFEGSVHFCDVEAAIGEARVTRRAGGARQLAVIEVAGEATQAFVHADGSAIVARSNLLRCAWSVALVAERLSRIGTDLHRAIPIFHFRQAQSADGNGLHLTAIEQSQGREHDLLLWPGRSHAKLGLLQRSAFLVSFVAGKARNYRVIGERAIPERPRTCGGDGLYEVTH